MSVQESISTDSSNRDIDTLNRRLDDLVAFQKKKGPWYRDTGLMISTAAFFISIATSAISAYRTYKQDINARKSSLQELIQQYNSIQLGNVSAQFSFQKEITGPTDPKLQMYQSFAIAANNTIGSINVAIAKKSLSLVNELGSNASSVDLGEVATILNVSGQPSSAEKLLTDAVSRAENSVEYVGALRGLGQVQYSLGKKDLANNTMKKALDVFSKYNGDTVDQDYVNFTHATTYLWWLQYFPNNDCGVTKENFQKVVYYSSLVPLTSATMQPQIADIRTRVSSCL